MSNLSACPAKAAGEETPVHLRPMSHSRRSGVACRGNMTLPVAGICAELNVPVRTCVDGGDTDGWRHRPSRPMAAHAGAD